MNNYILQSVLNSILIKKNGPRQKNGVNFKGICGTDYSVILNCIPVKFQISMHYAQPYTPTLMVWVFNGLRTDYIKVNNAVGEECACEITVSHPVFG